MNILRVLAILKITDHQLSIDKRYFKSIPVGKIAKKIV